MNRAPSDRRAFPYAARVLVGVIPLLLIAAVLAAVTYEPEEHGTRRIRQPPPEPNFIARLTGCGLTWERSWTFLEEGDPATEARRCLGVPDETERHLFDSVAVAQESEDARSGLCWGCGSSEAFLLDLLPHGAPYDLWVWRREEEVNQTYYDSVEVFYSVYLSVAGERGVLEKQRRVPIWESNVMIY